MFGSKSICKLSFEFAGGAVGHVNSAVVAAVGGRVGVRAHAKCDGKVARADMRGAACRVGDVIVRVRRVLKDAYVKPVLGMLLIDVVVGARFVMASV